MEQYLFEIERNSRKTPVKFRGLTDKRHNCLNPGLRFIVFPSFRLSETLTK